MATVQPSTFLQETNSESPTLRKIKREATPHTKPTQVASHFILPNRTTTVQLSSSVKIFLPFLPILTTKFAYLSDLEIRKT